MLVRRTTGSIGATHLLKVMAGDKVHVSVDYYYNTADASSTNNGTTAWSSIVSSIVNSLAPSSAPSNLIHGGESIINTQLNGDQDLNNKVNTLANLNPNNPSQQAPKAYLCVLFFDERFKFDKDHSVVVPVGYYPNQQKTIDYTLSNAISVVKSGYAYVYFTNESDELVYFDNFNLWHERGPIVDETHYYPFGLTMQGISSKALGFGGAMNKRKFDNGAELQSNEFADGSGLELYSTDLRSLDPQLGRWWQLDAKPDFSQSPYSAMNNNPIEFNDPLGDTTINGQKYVANDPSVAEYLPTVTVKAKAPKLSNAYLDILQHSPSLKRIILDNIPYPELLKMSGEKLAKLFGYELDKDPTLYTEVERVVAARIERLEGIGEEIDMIKDFLDYALAANEGGRSALPDPSGISSAIISDLTQEDEQFLLENAINMSRHGQPLWMLGNTISSINRKDPTGLTGTYISRSELLSIAINGGKIDRKQLTYSSYGYTDSYPTKNGVSYSIFILYSEKHNLLIPITVK